MAEETTGMFRQRQMQSDEPTPQTHIIQTSAGFTANIEPEDHALKPYGPFPRSWIDKGWVGYFNEAELKVAVVLCVHSDKSGDSFPGVQTIAREAGMATSGVHAAMNRLEAYGLMVRYQRRGQLTHYVLQQATKQAPRDRRPLGTGGVVTGPRKVDTRTPRRVDPPSPPYVEQGTPRSTPPYVEHNMVVNRPLEQTTGGAVGGTDHDDRAAQAVIADLSDEEREKFSETAINELVPENLRSLYRGKDPRTHAGMRRWLVTYLHRIGMI